MQPSASALGKCKQRRRAPEGRHKLKGALKMHPSQNPARFVLREVSCVLLFLALTIAAQDKSPAGTAVNDAVFDTKIASQLLSQVREGLEGRSQKKMFSTFDLARMSDGSLFKQQVIGFFNQTDAIRVHLNLVEVAATEGGQARVLIDAELEADPRNNSLPVHKRARLTLTAEKSRAGKGAAEWKFTSIEPRSFFSLQP